MVDTVNLRFVKKSGHRIINGVGRRQIRAQRLFQHHAHLAAVQPHRGQMAANGGKVARRGRQIANHFTAFFLRGQGGGQALETGCVIGIELDIVDALTKALPLRRIKSMFDVDARLGFHLLQIGVAPQIFAPQRPQAAVLIEQTGRMRLIQRRQQFAHHQITGAAKQHHIENRFIVHLRHSV